MFVDQGDLKMVENEAAMPSVLMQGLRSSRLSTNTLWNDQFCDA